MFKLNKLTITYLFLIILSHKINANFPFEHIPTIETKRLILRELTVNDIDGLFAITSDLEVAKLTSMFILHKNHEETLQYIQKSLDLYQKEEIIPWIVLEKETNKVIGFVRFLDYSASNMRAEIGYAFARRYWNNGLCTEAAQALIKFGFEVLQLVRIQATVDPKNIASNRVLEKCGMQYEGLLRNYKLVQGQACDRKMFAITKEDWLKSN